MSIIKTSTADPLATRLRSALRTKHGLGTGMASTSALLLDISGSMSEWCAPNKTKIAELRTLAAEFADVRRFTFSTSCVEMPPRAVIGDTEGGTNLAAAFLHVKTKGINHVVLITDGEPDDEAGALRASVGLRIDCFYVGHDPAPPFLHELCKASGGSYAKASMAALHQLAGNVRQRLQLTAGKGAIEL